MKKYSLLNFPISVKCFSTHRVITHLCFINSRKWTPRAVGSADHFQGEGVVSISNKVKNERQIHDGDGKFALPPTKILYMYLEFAENTSFKATSLVNLNNPLGVS